MRWEIFCEDVKESSNRVGESNSEGVVCGLMSWVSILVGQDAIEKNPCREYSVATRAFHLHEFRRRVAQTLGDNVGDLLLEKDDAMLNLGEKYADVIFLPQFFIP